jgi:hypothetical protein
MRVDAHVDGGVATIAFTGVLTKKSLYKAREDAERLIQGQDVTAVVARLDRAIVALTSVELGRAIEALRSDSPLRCPCALVVNEMHWQTFCDYAWYCMEHGFIRGVFLDLSQAKLWASLKAQVTDWGELDPIRTTPSRASKPYAACPDRESC